MAPSLSSGAVDGGDPGEPDAGPVAAPDGPGAAPGPLPVGAELSDGRYRLGAPLGRGGFGITYRAEDVRLRRAVAIKELLPTGARREGLTVVVPAPAAPGFASARERFLREATTLARFGHPNIVRIFAVFEEHGTAYLVLERLDGRTLAAELQARQAPFSEGEALDVAGQAAAALTAVHRAGVLHRDVSPANLMRTLDGRVVLIDFGLARPYVEDHTTSMTRIVTPGYAPPEQYAGKARFSPRADVYSLGATLYRLMSARIPPAPADRSRGAALTPLWRVNASVSRDVSAAIECALELEPDARPASVRTLLERLGVDASDLDLADEELDAEPDAAEEPFGLRPFDQDGADWAGDRSDRGASDAMGSAPASTAAPASMPGSSVGDGPDADRSVAARAREEPEVSWRPPTGSGGPSAANGGAARSRGRQANGPGRSSVGADPWTTVAPATTAVPPRPADPPPAVARLGAGPNYLVPDPGHGRGSVGPMPVAPADQAHRDGRFDRPAAQVVAPFAHQPLPGGASPPGRPWLTVPLGLAVTALASAQPATIVLALGLGAAPLLATAGDRLLRRGRNPAWIVPWWARNLGVAVVRSLGALVILAIGLLLWSGTEIFESLAPAGQWVLRATGVAAGGILALSVGRGGPGFRSHVALDALTVKLMPRGRVSIAVVVVGLVCLAVVATCLWFEPEAWPLGS